MCCKFCISGCHCNLESVLLYSVHSQGFGLHGRGFGSRNCRSFLLFYSESWPVLRGFALQCVSVEFFLEVQGIMCQVYRFFPSRSEFRNKWRYTSGRSTSFCGAQSRNLPHQLNLFPSLCDIKRKFIQIFLRICTLDLVNYAMFITRYKKSFHFVPT